MQGLTSGCFPSLPPDDETSDTSTTDSGTNDAANPAGTPSGVTASDDDPDAVTITWQRVIGANGYRVERCDDDCDRNDRWTTVSAATSNDTTVVDSSAVAGPLPAAPELTLDSVSTGAVAVRWTTPVGTPGPMYRYRVIALSDGFESAPSAVVTGRRAAAEVEGFELRRNGGDWAPVIGTTLRDTEAPAPTLTGGTATATKGTSAEHVVLKLLDFTTAPGADVTYEVRALTTVGTTNASNMLRAAQVAPTVTALTITWERSLDTTADAFEPIVGARGAEWLDTGAPADGAIRHYRARVSAEGLADALSTTVIGSRAPPAGQVANFKATTDLSAHIQVSWDRLDDATGYRLYRNGVMVVEVGPNDVAWLDTSAALAPTGSWGAPTEVVASTDRQDGIMLTWQTPAAPTGPDASYEIEPLTATGTGPRTGPVVGRRVAEPPSSFAGC